MAPPTSRYSAPARWTGWALVGRYELLLGPPQPDGEVTGGGQRRQIPLAVALDIPIAAETSAADIGFSYARNACSTSCLVEEAAMVAA